MTKLEEKLIELGYEEYSSYGYYSRLKNDWVYRYSKYDGDIEIVIDCNIEKQIIDSFIYHTNDIRQRDLNLLQQAFDTLQKDLKELELCQS